MELPSDDPLRSEPPVGARRRCRPLTGADHISGLPDDLLLQILVRLRCARAAAHTSLVSRRWRGLWRFLPELSFRGIARGTLETALARVARTELCLLDVNVPEHHRYSAAAVAGLLRAAARLAPLVLRVVVRGDINDSAIPVEVPVFHRATSIELDVVNLHLTPPAQGGDFPMLERLCVSSSHLDSVFLVSQCPCLRVLELRRCWGLDTVTVHSTTVEEVVVSHNGWIRGVDIVAPALKKITMDARMGTDFKVSFLAPFVKDISLHCSCDVLNVGITEEWFLRKLDLWMKEGVCALDLTIERVAAKPYELDLMQQIAQLPNFSVLGLYLVTWGHVFGGMALNLLGNCAAIQSLKLVIRRLETVDEECPPNCPCDQPQDWRNQNISLMALEEVKIEKIGGSRHEVDFMKLLFRSAPLMKRMIVTLAPKVISSSRKCKKIFKIFKANPSVKCYVYSSCGTQVVYA